MPTSIITLPTFQDDSNAVDVLIGIYKKVIDNKNDTNFDFSNCCFLTPDAIAFLGGLWRLLQYKGYKVSVTGTKGSPAFNFLMGTGFTKSFGLANRPLHATTTQFRQDILQDKDAIVHYLSQWLGIHVSVSANLKREIISNVWEIYSNSFEHGHSPIGTLSFGQLYPKVRQLRLTLVDFGVGIVTSVSKFLNSPNMASEDALRWAFEEGNSTKTNISRGMGLELLRDFVTINGGELEVISNDGQVTVDDSGIKYKTRQLNFEGTMAHITVRCDSRHYRLIDENDTSPIF